MKDKVNQIRISYKQKIGAKRNVTEVMVSEIVILENAT